MFASSLLLLLTALGIALTHSTDCRVINDSEFHKYDRTYSALTSEAACRKAYAICSYYSADIKNCRIIKK